MYTLIKRLKKNKDKKHPVKEKVLVNFTDRDITYSGRAKILEALREITGDPNFNFDTVNVEFPVENMVVETNDCYEEWQWQ